MSISADNRKEADFMRGSAFPRQELFNTPKDLSQTMIQVLKPSRDNKIYDGAFGSLELFLAAKEYIEKNQSSSASYANFYGREINNHNYGVAIKVAEENGIDPIHLSNENSLESEGTDKEKYDLIISHLPFGMKGVKKTGELGFDTRDGTNLFLQHYINSLRNGGKAGIIVSHSFFFSSDKSAIELRKFLLESCNLHTVLELPPKTFKDTGIGSSVLFFTKGKPTEKIKYFHKTPDEDYSAFVDFVTNENKNESSFIIDINDIDKDNFMLPTASKLLIEKEVTEKSKNFRSYKRYKAEEVFLSINSTKESFIEKKNATYLPIIGKSKAISDLKEATLKHQNYFQLVLNPEILSDGYFTYYLNSSLGQMMLESCYSGSTIPKISKGEFIKNFEVYAPDLEEQGMISSTFEELKSVMSIMEKTAMELSSDPNSARNILEKLYETKKAFNELSQEERLLKVIKGGETKKVEFKQTLSMDIKTIKKEKYIELAVLKTIAAFLNTEGGTLFVGVNDAGKITGVENEIDKFFKSDDKYLLHLKSLIKAKVGEEFYPFIDYDLVNLMGSKIILVSCKKAKKPCYLDKNDFYVRTNPATDKLEGPKLVEYVQSHFS